MTMVGWHMLLPMPHSSSGPAKVRRNLGTLPMQARQLQGEAKNATQHSVVPIPKARSVQRTAMLLGISQMGRHHIGLIRQDTRPNSDSRPHTTVPTAQLCLYCSPTR